ncbi:pitrilysin family protein [Cytophagales bacterium LB-30]|uniref:Pitrilysin family protein n=1 Tax=Shiella aurantiaca TaxID=3058365 RepID=A0ABT8F709_9BACT|nr:pitrilysin family protein [Shiella aurantiaca]MDN4166178.1 pitrilysin family protein [Shiella aurantiaca]
MRKLIIMASLLSLVGAHAMAQGKAIAFEQYKLDNGLQVILHEDHTTPIVAVTVMYHVGSKNENPERTGFAHFFEHLLFEGSENIERGQYMKIIEAAGGALNANTSNDRTFYYEILPSNQLELGLYMESERLLHAKIDQVGVETQREVVKEEKRQRIDNQPYGSFAGETFKRAFKVHPYRWMPIGSMDHLNAATLEEFIEFYKTFYVPQNAILSIAGDINVAETKKLVEKYFAEIPAGTREIPRPNVVEPAQTEEIRDVVYDNIQLPAVFQSYHMPAQGTDDYYALNMLTQILSAGKSSRLNKELTDNQQKALQVFAFPYALEDPGLFITLGIVNMGVKPEDLEAAMDVEIEKVKNELITEEEFQKIRNQVENDFVSGNATMAGIAESLANYQMYFGDANLINTEIERYMKVTREDIKAVANKYLNKENRVVLYYLPQSQKPE